MGADGSAAAIGQVPLACEGVCGGRCDQPDVAPMTSGDFDSHLRLQQRQLVTAWRWNPGSAPGPTAVQKNGRSGAN
jgi:hypothetical protein